MANKKNNHFVPRSYLKRFCSGSERQIGLYNLNSGQSVDNARKILYLRTNSPKLKHDKRNCLAKLLRRGAFPSNSRLIERCCRLVYYFKQGEQQLVLLIETI